MFSEKDWNTRFLLTNATIKLQPENRQRGAAQIRHAWGQFFGKWLGPLPPRIAAPCCAEFIASRDAVRRQPKEFYAAALEWIAATELGSKAIAISVEFVWHLIFQPEPWLVVAQRECLCALYGLRNLPPQFAGWAGRMQHLWAPRGEARGPFPGSRAME